jgi:hypothetical protein
MIPENWVLRVARNPVEVEELTKSILESGELKEAGDHYDYDGSAGAVIIPATLRDSLMARLDRFMPVKEIAQIGAVIGREFSYELIAAVAPMPQAQLNDALVQLSALGLAFRRGTPPDAVYTFKHALIQHTAYHSLLKSRRQELHGKIARVIEQRFPSVTSTEPEVLAHHLTAAGLIEDAIPLWRAAGELASKRMALPEAIESNSAIAERIVNVVKSIPDKNYRNIIELPAQSAEKDFETMPGDLGPTKQEILQLTADQLAQALAQHAGTSAEDAKIIVDAVRVNAPVMIAAGEKLLRRKPKLSKNDLTEAEMNDPEVIRENVEFARANTQIRIGTLGEAEANKLRRARLIEKIDRDRRQKSFGH